MTQPTRQDFIEYVSYVVDDALNGRELGADPHAIVREAGEQFKYASVLVGWQCGYEPLFVAVHSCMDCPVDDDEAVELATDYLRERGWFDDGDREHDHIIR